MTAQVQTRTLFATTPSPLRVRGGLMGLLDTWRQRQALARLDADALNDIGISAGAARREASKPIWDVPAHWRR